MVWKRDRANFIDFVGQLKNQKREIEEIEDIPKVNKEIILKYDERCQCCLQTRVSNMTVFKFFLLKSPKKPFRAFERDDFNPWLKFLKEKHKPSTFNTYLNVVKRLFRFALDLEDDETPSCMKGIKHSRIDQREREQWLSQSILNKEEILRLIQATPNKKYKAMVATLFDGALRKSELMNINIKEDLNINDDYIDLTVRNGKGGKTDIITLVESVPYIKAWLSEHPFYEGTRTLPSTPLWTRSVAPLFEMVEVEGKKIKKVYRLKKWSIEWLLPNLAKKAGIKKKIWPHLTRHSKISSMVNDEGYTLLEAKHHARHRSLNSTILYLHLEKNNQLRNKMLEKAGKLKVEKKVTENPFKVILCPRCSEENIPTNKFCLRCGWDFSKDLKQVKLESGKEAFAKEFMNFVVDNPDATKFLETMMRTFMSQKKQTENGTAKSVPNKPVNHSEFEK
jgi:integrase/recombinase XerD